MIKIYSSDKFKQTGLWASFIVDTKKESILILKIIARMLQDHCQKYQTKKEIAEYLDYLFGSSLNVYAIQIGKYSNLVIRIKSINEKYVDIPLLEKEVEFLEEIIYKYDFDQRSFEEAVRLQIDSIKRRNDNPINFTVNSLLKKCTENTYAYANYYDDIDFLNNLTLDDIKNAYESLLENAKLEVFFSGECKQEEVMKVIKKSFPDKNYQYDKASFLLNAPLNKEDIEVTREIPQSCFAQFYNFEIDVTDINKYNALLIGCDILGGNPTSLLFSEIREKRSLCYSISSLTTNSYDGLIVLTSISLENVEKVRELIKEQIERIKNGDFPDELLENSKKFRINSLISIEDSIGGKASYELDNLLYNSNTSIDELIRIVGDIRKDDVIAAFKNVALKQSMVLKGVKHD